MNPSTYEDLCFVIMPFGKRTIADREYDFDAIYRNVFEIAIGSVSLRDNRRLRPKRADSSNTAGIITQEMFRDILYARIVLADITGLNPNVFYELGVRHALRPTSTVVYKEVHSTIPFDVRDLRIFDYDVDGLSGFGGAVSRIRTSLETSLVSESLDSPVVTALRDDIRWPTIDFGTQSKIKLVSWLEDENNKEVISAYSSEAKEAIMRRDYAAAESCFRGALSLVPDQLNLSMGLALLLRDRGDFKAAEPILLRVTETHPTYAPAWREFGVCLHKLKKASEAVRILLHATKLNEYDADAWGALGGVHKSLGQFGEAQDAYLQSLHLDAKNPYPLLNFIAVFAQNNRALPDMAQHESNVQVAESTCKAEIAGNIRLPWSHFDLAQIQFLRGDFSGFQTQFSLGAKCATAKWQVETAAKTYSLLRDSSITKPDAKAASKFAEKILAEFVTN